MNKANSDNEIVLDKKTRDRYINLLTSVYNIELNEVSLMSDSLLQKTLIEKQEKSISDSKNPNKFWILKDLPSPQDHKTTTSAKAGWIVIIVFLILLVIVGLIFMILALTNHNVI